MEPAEYFAAAAAALALLKAIKAQVADLFATGKITPEQQAELAKLEKQVHDGYAPLFEGYQWTKSDGTKSGSQMEYED